MFDSLSINILRFPVIENIEGHIEDKHLIKENNQDALRLIICMKIKSQILFALKK